MPAVTRHPHLQPASPMHTQGPGHRPDPRAPFYHFALFSTGWAEQGYLTAKASPNLRIPPPPQAGLASPPHDFPRLLHLCGHSFP